MNQPQTYRRSSFHVGWMRGALVSDNSSRVAMALGVFYFILILCLGDGGGVRTQDLGRGGHLLGRGSCRYDGSAARHLGTRLELCF